MIKTTERFHVYQAPAEGHTQRDEDVIAAENAAHPDRWIDPEAHQELWLGLREIDGYNVLLGDALDAYNAKQVRKDRRMTMEEYRESVKADTRGRKNAAIAAANRRAEAAGRPQDIRKEKGKCTSFEVVFSLGNVKPLRDANGRLLLDAGGKRQTPGRVPDDVADAIQRAYVGSFQQRNPNLFLCSAMQHTGEWAKVLRGGEDITGLGGPPGQWVRGASHVHLNVIPWAEGYKQGMSRQVSTGKALAAMGFAGEFQGKKMVKSPWEQWQERERAYIAELAKQYGYEIVREGERETALSPKEYQEIEELRQDALDAVADAQAQAEQVKGKAQAEAAKIVADAKDKADKVQEETEKARRKAQADARTFEKGLDALKYVDDMTAFMARHKNKTGQSLLDAYRAEQQRQGKMSPEDAAAAAAAAQQLLEQQRREENDRKINAAKKTGFAVVEREQQLRQQQGGKSLYHSSM